MPKKIFYSFITFFILLGAPLALPHHDSSTIPSLGREDGSLFEEKEKRWFFDFTFEQRHWDEIPAREAHELHEEGHHIHDKTHEEFYHFFLGLNLFENFNLTTEIPYVVRGFIEIEDHERLGEKETSKGWGDLNLLGTYRFLKEGENYLGAVGGVKFPTGETKGKNSQGIRLDPEFQPGTSSYDYPIGVVYQYTISPFIVRGNIIYVIKTEGDQDFEFGDLFSTSLFLDYVMNPSGNGFQVVIGLDLNFQYEEKQEERGLKVTDSGGTALFLGPALKVQLNDNVSLFGNILFPVHQNLGGVHQEVDFVWSLGARIAW